MVRKATGGLRRAHDSRDHFNEIFHAGYATWVREQEMLLSTHAGDNSVTSGWEKTGLCPFNPNSGYG